MSFLSAHRQKLLITLIHTRPTVCRTGTYTDPQKTATSMWLQQTRAYTQARTFSDQKQQQKGRKDENCSWSPELVLPEHAKLFNSHFSQESLYSAVYFCRVRSISEWWSISAWCSLFAYGALCVRMVQSVFIRCTMLLYGAVYFHMVQSIFISCSMFPYGAVYFHVS